jgi:prevent-host-death family protein
MATKLVNVHEAKTHLSRLLDEVAQGQEVILAKAGRPCAKLVPLPVQTGKRRLALLSGRLDDSFFEPLPPEELKLWTGEG